MKTKLNTEDRRFFALATQIATVNTFSEEQIKIYRKILPDFPPIPGQISKRKKYQDDQNQMLKVVLGKYIGKLRQKGFSNIQHFKGKDRKLVELGFLLDTYLCFVNDLDKLIQNQLALKDTLANIAFAEKCIRQLKLYGFSDQECSHYFALFYQLRRAYYFISSLVGDSPSMKKLRVSLWNNIFTHNSYNITTAII